MTRQGVASCDVVEDEALDGLWMQQQELAGPAWQRARQVSLTKAQPWTQLFLGEDFLDGVHGSDGRFT
jgi:hypothetical protein